MPDDPKSNGAQSALAEIYMLALSAKTMTLMAQGKPMHPDHPHTASEYSPSKALEQSEKAEVMLDLLIEKLDVFAKGFGLPEGWWRRGFSGESEPSGD